MSKKYTCSTVIGVFLLLQGCSTFSPKEDTSLTMDGLKVMTMVNKRDRGEDYIISSSWKLAKKGRIRHSMQYKEKRKNYGDEGDFNYKSVIRYIDPPRYYGTAILTWNYKEGKREHWFIRMQQSRRSAKRTITPDLLNPPAESDFSLPDYIDINVDEETHQLLSSKEYEGNTCFLVESVPTKQKLIYGKRISWIDQQRVIPLKIEYYDKEGNLWKTLHIEWQNKDGLWFWKKAEVENIKVDYKTFINIEEVRVNIGLRERDFTKVSLETKELGF